MTLLAAASSKSALPFRVSRRTALLALLLIAFNVGCYALPIPYALFGNLAYLGAFIITFIANATVFIPVPYLPVLMHLGSTHNLVLLVLTAAFASMLGESVSYLVGVRGRSALSSNRIVMRMQSLAYSPVRSWAFLFAVALPPNPFFDVAGLAAGALGFRYTVFATSVFAARILRFLAILLLSQTFLGP